MGRVEDKWPHHIRRAERVYLNNHTHRKREREKGREEALDDSIEHMKTKISAGPVRVCEFGWEREEKEGGGVVIRIHETGMQTTNHRGLLWTCG